MNLRRAASSASPMDAVVCGMEEAAAGVVGVGGVAMVVWCGGGARGTCFAMWWREVGHRRAVAVCVVPVAAWLLPDGRGGGATAVNARLTRRATHPMRVWCARSLPLRHSSYTRHSYGRGVRGCEKIRPFDHHPIVLFSQHRAPAVHVRVRVCVSFASPRVGEHRGDCAACLLPHGAWVPTRVPLVAAGRSFTTTHARVSRRVALTTQSVCGGDTQPTHQLAKVRSLAPQPPPQVRHHARVVLCAAH